MPSQKGVNTFSSFFLCCWWNHRSRICFFLVAVGHSECCTNSWLNLVPRQYQPGPPTLACHHGSSSMFPGGSHNCRGHLLAPPRPSVQHFHLHCPTQLGLICAFKYGKHGWDAVWFPLQTGSFSLFVSGLLQTPEELQQMRRMVLMCHFGIVFSKYYEASAPSPT